MWFKYFIANMYVYNVNKETKFISQADIRKLQCYCIFYSMSNRPARNPLAAVSGVTQIAWKQVSDTALFGPPRSPLG